MPLVDIVPDLDRGLTGSVTSSLGAATSLAVPFPHWRLCDVLPEPTARELAGLPFRAPDPEGVSGRRELHNSKRVYLAGRVLRDHPVARRLAAAFWSAAVTEALMAITGAPLSGSFLRIELALDVDGFWLEPHTDLGVKLLTVFLQLAGPGQEDLGTDLYWTPDLRAGREPFAWNAALMFRPSDRSWHGFEPRPIEGVRRSLIVNYVTAEWRSREQLAFDDPVAP